MDEKFLSGLRFEDSTSTIPIKFEQNLKLQLRQSRTSLLSNSLRVTENTVSLVHKKIVQCAKLLGINPDEVDAYIYSKPDYNAFSISQENNCILIAFSSSLIKILDENELSFLIGHELGHALYKHSESTHLAGNIEDYDVVKALRDMEISADRIGFVCTNSLESAITSMIKMASGLDSNFLDLDVRPFIAQTVPLDHGDHMIYSTHPPLPLRARALVWLSTMPVFKRAKHFPNLQGYDPIQITKINQNIRSDLNKYVDSAFNQKFESLKKFFQLTLYTLCLSKNSVLTKKSQNFLIGEFGPDATKLFKTISGLRSQSAQNFLLTKTKDTFKEMNDTSAIKSDQCLKESSISIGISEKDIRSIIYK